ncbi:MAG: hypothetical protein U0T81_04200 [Saprospiraceae bacterium]
MACQDQSVIDSKFNAWKTTASFTGGCNGVLTNNGASAPNHCGGTATVTFTVTSDCEAPKTCTATFTVNPAPAVVITCPANVTEVACQSQSTIDSKFNAWKTTASFTGGCNGVLSTITRRHLQPVAGWLQPLSRSLPIVKRQRPVPLLSP